MPQQRIALVPCNLHCVVGLHYIFTDASMALFQADTVLLILLVLIVMGCIASKLQ